MKVSDLIQRLQLAQIQHGDLEVAILCGEFLHFRPAMCISVVDQKDTGKVTTAEKSLGDKFIHIEDF